MTYRSPWMLLLGLVLAVYSAGQAQAKEEETLDNAIMNHQTTDFERQVVSAGGRADFVFSGDPGFPQCHASTLVQTADGSLLCAWFGGTREKHPDVGIWMSRFSAGQWAVPWRVAKVEQTAHWNPVLFRGADATVHLFFKVGKDVPVWRTWKMFSTDGGATWSPPQALLPGDTGGRGPVKNKAILLADGAWLAPASIEEPGEKGAWRPFADRSEDEGKTWQRSADWRIDRVKLPGVGAIQPTLWESKPGIVHALMRSAGGRVWRADSSDGGKSWGEVYATALPNNNSGIDLARLDDGRLALLYNPVEKNWGPRTPLDVAVSADNGVTWRTVGHLETAPKSEFSYPSIVRTKEGLALSYTWNRKVIRCWQIPLALLDAH